MKLLQKIKNTKEGMVIETAIEYDDGTRHPKLGILSISPSGFFIVEQWEILKQLVINNPEKYHMIVDLGKRD